MISHVTLGTNDLNRATDYYDKLLSLLGAKQVAKTDEVVFYSFPEAETKLAITKPYNGDAAASGNGIMLALKAENTDKVKEIYNAAISMGSECEGEPGPRNNGAYFAAYFRDLDGHKIAVFYRE